MGESPGRDCGFKVMRKSKLKKKFIKKQKNEN